METPAPLRCVVAVPFHRDVALLERALASLRAQSDRAWTAIVVDDSADEPTRAALDDMWARLASADPRWSLDRPGRQLGIAGAFQRCFDVAVARGADILTVLHADDLLGPEYLARVRAAHEAFPAAAAVAVLAAPIDDADRPTRTLGDTVKHLLWPRRAEVLRGDRGLRRLLTGQFLYCPAVSFRAAAIVNGTVPRWNPRWRQVMDLELFAGTLLRGGEIALVSAGSREQPLYRYRRHHASATTQHTATLHRALEEAQVSEELRELARRRGWHRSARAARWRVTVRANTALQAAALLRRDGRAARRAMMLAVAPRPERRTIR